jgi:hypothetical protein
MILQRIDKCTISKNGAIFAIGYWDYEDKIFAYDLRDFSPSLMHNTLTLSPMPKDQSLRTWHLRLGHRHEGAILAAVQKELLIGIKSSYEDLKDQFKDN